MRRSHLRRLTVAAAALATFLASARPAAAQREAPRGVGAIAPGPEAGLVLGTGFASVYNVGVSGRLGYAFRSGFYLGGAFTQYVGTASTAASFFGAEGGYKLLAAPRLEIRPYVFLGPSLVDRGFGSDLGFAVQPSMLVAYHLGPWFLVADARLYVVPQPASGALLFGGGVEF